MKKINYKLVLYLVLIDYFIKEAVRNLHIEIIPNLFKIFYIENSGIAFGYLLKKFYFIIIFSIILITLFVIYIYNLKMYNNKLCIYSSCILAGSLGNLIDRIFNGYVTDYLSILNFPIFNLADMLIVFGIFFFIIELNAIEKQYLKKKIYKIK